MIPPAQWNVNQVQMRNTFGWNGNRSNQQNRRFNNFLSSNFNQGSALNSKNYDKEKQRYQQYVPSTPLNQISSVPTRKLRSFSNPI